MIELESKSSLLISSSPNHYQFILIVFYIYIKFYKLGTSKNFSRESTGTNPFA